MQDSTRVVRSTKTARSTEYGVQYLWWVVIEYLYGESGCLLTEYLVAIRLRYHLTYLVKMWGVFILSPANAGYTRSGPLALMHYISRGIGGLVGISGLALRGCSCKEEFPQQFCTKYENAVAVL